MDFLLINIKCSKDYDFFLFIIKKFNIYVLFQGLFFLYYVCM